MAYWLIKSDPEKMSFSDLAEEGYKGYEWAGVREEETFDHFTNMAPRDLAFFYHEGDENRFYGIVRILEAASADSTDETGQWLSANIAVFLRLISRVPLASVKQNDEMAKFAKRVEEGPSIQSVSSDEWTAICLLADMPKIPK